LRRGQEIIYYSFKHARPIWLVSALPKLVDVWALEALELSEKQRLSSIEPLSDEFNRELRLRYGILQPHYKNDGLPLGITKTDVRGEKSKYLFPGIIRTPLFGRTGELGMNLNCLFCHARAVPTSTGWAIAEGIGNTTIDFQRFHNDLSNAAGTKPGVLMKRNPKRNTFVNAGDALAEVAALVRRDDDSFDPITLGKAMGSSQLTPELQAFSEYLKTVPLMKTAAWVALGPKRDAGVKGYYADSAWTGGFSQVLAGIMISLHNDGADYTAYRDDFNTHAWPYLQSLQSPKFPWISSLPTENVQKGAVVFHSICSQCHGTYRAVDASKNEYQCEEYPGILVPLEIVGTDPRRVQYSDEVAVRKVASGRKLFMMNEKERGGSGYNAPPLNGIWARAPYLHNGSVPYLSQVLDSKSRFRVFAMDLAKHDPIDGNSYDRAQGGWAVEDYSSKSLETIDLELRQNPYLRVFDPRLPEVIDAGLSNTGHTFGDDLSDEERSNLIQFLLTL